MNRKSRYQPPPERRSRNLSPRYRERGKSPPRRLNRSRTPPRYRKRSRSPPRWYRSKSPPHYSERKESPPRYFERRESPQHYGRRNNSPYYDRAESSSHYLEKNESPPRYTERSRSPLDYRGGSPPYFRHGESSQYLDMARDYYSKGRESPTYIAEKGNSQPDYLEGNTSPSHYLERDRSPVYYVNSSQSPVGYLERNQSPVHFMKRSESPAHFMERSESPAHFIARSESPAHFVERSESPAYFMEKSKSPAHFMERSESPHHFMERSESPHHYLERTISPLHSREKSPPDFREVHDPIVPPYPGSPGKNVASPQHYLEPEKHDYYYGDEQQWFSKEEHQFGTLTASKAESQTRGYVTKEKKQLNSLEEIAALADKEIKAFYLSGASQKKVMQLCHHRKITYFQAKRVIIREKFITQQKLKSKRIRTAQARRPALSGFHQPVAAPGDIGKPSETSLQEPIPEEADVPEELAQDEALPNSEDEEGPESESLEKVPIAHENYPKVMMGFKKLVQLQKSILGAYESVPRSGPQLRFKKATFRPGILLVTCVDKMTADWLRKLVPRIQLPKGRRLKILKDAKPQKAVKCTVFVPDDKNGERLSLVKILHRLRTSNKGMRTRFWTAISSTEVADGQVWILSVDEYSLDMIKELDMKPYFGFSSVEFKLQ